MLNKIIKRFESLIHLIKYVYYKCLFLEIHYSDYIIEPYIITPDCIIAKGNFILKRNARIEGIKYWQHNQHHSKYYHPTITFNFGVRIEQNCHITCANKIEIGENTAIGANVTITDIHHKYDDINIPIEKQDLEVKAVQIGPDCKIYNGSIILPGVIIGKHVTIGANSVVTHNIPDYSVAVGSPARIIKRYNFTTQKWEKTDEFGNFINSLIETSKTSLVE